MKSGFVETPPHPNLLRGPSKTGVNALMASGEKEHAPARRNRLGTQCIQMEPP
jgi:hypothetical protein